MSSKIPSSDLRSEINTVETAEVMDDEMEANGIEGAWNGVAVTLDKKKRALEGKVGSKVGYFDSLTSFFPVVSSQSSWLSFLRKGRDSKSDSESKQSKTKEASSSSTISSIGDGEVIPDNFFVKESQIIKNGQSLPVDDELYEDDTWKEVTDKEAKQKVLKETIRQDKEIDLTTFKKNNTSTSNNNLVPNGPQAHSSSPQQIVQYNPIEQQKRAVANADRLLELYSKDPKTITFLIQQSGITSWVETTSDLKTFCDFLLDPDVKVGNLLNKIELFKKTFPDFFISSLGFYYQCKADQKISLLKGGVADEKLNNEILSQLEPGLKNLKDTIPLFLKISQFTNQKDSKNYQDFKWFNFEALSKALEIIVLRNNLKKEINLTQGKISDCGSKLDTIERVTQLNNYISAYKKELEKIELDINNYTSNKDWVSYLSELFSSTFFNSKASTSEVEYLKEIKNFSKEISSQHKAKEILAALTKLKNLREKGDEFYDTYISSIEKQYLDKQNRPVKLKDILEEISHRTDKQNYIMTLEPSSNLKIKKPKFWESLRNFFGIWSDADKKNNKETINAVRTKIQAEYGSLAVRRFDYNFAYRYHIGGPMTTVALSKFLEGEQLIIKVSIQDLYGDEKRQPDKTLEQQVVKLAEDAFNEKYKAKIYKEENKEEYELLHAHFLDQFINRPLEISDQQFSNFYSNVKNLNEYSFWGSRLSAIYTSLFSDDRRSFNQETIDYIIDHKIKKNYLQNFNEVKQAIKQTLKPKTKIQSQTVTFKDLCFVNDEFDKAIFQEDTLYKRYFRSYVRWLADALSVAGILAATSKASNPTIALITAAAATAVSFEAEPEQRLVLGLSLLGSAMMSSSSSSGSSLFSTAVKGAVSFVTGGVV